MSDFLYEVMKAAGVIQIVTSVGLQSDEAVKR